MSIVFKTYYRQWQFSRFLWGFLINPAVSEANIVDTCKHFEIRSGSVRNLSHLPVFVIEHLCRADQHETNKIK